MKKCFSPEFTHYKQSLRVVDFLERDGQGLNLTYEVRDGILNHTGSCMANTLEGVVVKYADRIAYVNHDLDDAFFGGVLSKNDIPKHLAAIFCEDGSDRIDTMVNAVIEASVDQPRIAMTAEIEEAMNEMRDYLDERVYQGSPAKIEEYKGEALLCRLFEYYVAHPEELPAFFRAHIEDEGKERMVCDYIAGMTDQFAIRTYQRLFIPEVWKGKSRD